MGHRATTLLFCAAALFFAAAVFLYLDHFHLLPWSSRSGPPDLGLVRPNVDREIRLKLIRRKRAFEAAVERGETREERARAQRARRHFKKSCILFGLRRYPQADKAMDLAFKALDATATTTTTIVRRPRPGRPTDTARWRRELEERLKKVQEALEANPKESLKKDFLFDALAEAYTLLDGGDLEGVERKTEEAEYGLGTLPR